LLSNRKIVDLKPSARPRSDAPCRSAIIIKAVD
jgi:hypothetical protein